ncbi:hypothetical protein ADIARSV_0281 [Arcticibacter svalbardensis MN12-7]|uniref:Uncharacterized protein n=1 Tax=Arcticibacter svalbardensis MN12-7 TaxID=1150600 RepID=R9GXF3_9SPHI|nr:hypothetical protein [Arcticibacter svalbardensis]EOR96497.1 hypothetical protein ADIARSV_0281 [Arcticibacter svalbardensis MN12-7]
MVKFLMCLDTSNWIDLLGIIANLLFAWWIVIAIQNKINNKRVLKDHFIQDLKEIRNDYRLFFINIDKGVLLPNEILPWFKLMNIKVKDLLDVVKTVHKIDIYQLDPFKKDLNELMSENSDFKTNYRSEQPIVFSGRSKRDFIKFQGKYISRFNEILILINSAN